MFKTTQDFVNEMTLDECVAIFLESKKCGNYFFDSRKVSTESLLYKKAKEIFDYQSQFVKTDFEGKVDLVYVEILRRLSEEYVKGKENV